MTIVSEKNNLEKPQTIFLKDYSPPDFFVNNIDLHFDLKEPYTTVTSEMNITRRHSEQPLVKDLVLQGEDLTLDLIQINQQILNDTQYQLTHNGLVIFNVPDQFQLTIKTKIKPQENTQLSGLYRSRDTYCTQCEAEGFRRITYYLDRPDVLARFTTTIVANKKRYPILLSNGNLVEAGELDNGDHWVKWEDPFKKPSYLFALVAGDFDVLEDSFVTLSGRRIALRIYAEKGYGDQCDHAMQSVKHAMLWDEQTYGREYDLDIYMIVAIDDFNMGAMENKGLNIFNTKYILAKTNTATDEDFVHVESVIGHEYFHNWSGNRVTCRDWFQLSLKEGLTIFRDQSFTADSISPNVARIHDVNALRIGQFSEDAGPLAHAVRPDSYIEINNFYTTTIYNKGAEVIRMMQTILGKELFRKGMDLYFSRHDGQAVTIEDFVKAMEDVSNIDLSQFRLWYSQAGTPVLTVSRDYHPDAKTYTLTIQQSCPPTPEQPHKLPFHIPVKMGLLNEQGDEILLNLDEEKPEASKTLPIKKMTEVFTFKNINSHPIPSLLRDFSAPVKLHFNYSDDELKLLFKSDTNGFSRWEAGQKYAERILLKLVNDHQHNKPLQLSSDFIDTFKHVLESKNIDAGLLAEMLTLPSERYLADQMEIVDVEGIHIAREFVLAELAKALKPALQNTYQQFDKSLKGKGFDATTMGQRQLKNLCLAYLMLLSDEDIQKLAKIQFETSLTTNMTDTMAALKTFANIDSPLSKEVLDKFYTTWQKEALIVNKWFAIQAASKLPMTLQNVKTLVEHPAFDIKNPNKVYALIGTFCQANAVRFHDISGEGYRFLGKYLLQLDKLNPQIAARMIKPLTDWKRYDEKRQHLMKEQLQYIVNTKSISNDVYELASKSLA